MAQEARLQISVLELDDWEGAEQVFLF